LRRAMKVDAPFLLEVVTRGDVPMPRTGYWDIADFLQGGNDKHANASEPRTSEIART